MVSRKPILRDTPPDSSSHPYLSTSASADVPQIFGQLSKRRESPAADNAADVQNAWSSGGMDSTSKESLPASLRVKDGKLHSQLSLASMEIPESLRIRTPTPDHTPRSSEEIERPKNESTNPYLRRQQIGQSGTDGGESSAGAWGGLTDKPQQPLTAPPPLQGESGKLDYGKSSGEQISELPVDENTNPWGSSITVPLRQAPPVPVPQLQSHDSGNQAWSGVPEYSQATFTPPVLITLPTEEDESPAWDETDSRTSDQLFTESVLPQPRREDQKAWEETETRRRQQEDALTRERVAQEEYLRSQAGGWETNLQEQESGVVNADGTIQENDRPALPTRPSEEQAPALPPRRSQETVSTTSRPALNTGIQSESSVTSPGGTSRQKKETYEIKNVSWYDATASQNPRVSPILVQNANGPCPLLALVNALTLSTPAELNTALVETLRSREQVSLGLLLDAVFDELMSGRRGDAAHELPDVGDLYSFLITLHTGMNVNPRFFPPAATNKFDDPRRSMSHVHPSEREEFIPGTFEETREMKLYSTFSIPLIHGWLPAANSPAYAALKRSANSYEDAQNLMFREEELEDKLQREGLNFEEQATLEDIATIKAFFLESATQLTPFGLGTISKSIAPGSVAILFRNDHFSTLYRHPESHQLLHLVTDMGYAGHEEIIWESLVDVNGENCEFFSGDFRLVGGARPSSETEANESEWSAVSHRRGQSQQSHSHQSIDATLLSTSSETVPPMFSNTEQEDHDLALALQLQEEEEERHRAETARRRHESELSQQFIEQSSSGPPALQVSPQGRRNTGAQSIPVVSTRGNRRGSGDVIGQASRGGAGPRRGTSELRPAIPPRRSNVPEAPRVDPEAGVDVPPPSYEQASSSPAYNPPPNHPSHPSASPNSSISRTARRTSAYSQNAANLSGGQPVPPVMVGRQSRSNTSGSRAGALINEGQGHGRGQSMSAQQGAYGEQREDKCILM